MHMPPEVWRYIELDSPLFPIAGEQLDGYSLYSHSLISRYLFVVTEVLARKNLMIQFYSCN